MFKQHRWVKLSSQDWIHVAFHVEPGLGPCSQQERQPGTAAREQPAGSHDPLPDQRPAGRDQFCQLQQSVEMLQKQVNRMEAALQEALKHLECRDKVNSGQGPTDSTD